MFDLHYHVSNNGDGSVCVNFHRTRKEAEEADANQADPWGESSAETLRLKVEDGKIHYRIMRWDGKQYHEEWVPVQEEQ